MNTSIATEQQTETVTSDENDITTPMFEETKTNISSSIGPAVSTPSPSSSRHYQPMSLTSTQTYFNTLQQPKRTSSPNIQQVQTIIHNDDDDDVVVARPRTSSMKRGDKKETTTSVRFVGKDENGRKAEETFL